jgi:hypothetical protein
MEEFALKNNKSEIVKKLLNYGANTDKLSEIEKFKLLCIVENISAGRVDTLIEEIKGDDICPITLEQFTELKEPVLCTDGYIYEKAGIQAHWNSKGGSDSLGPSPTTRDQISIVSPRLNTALKSLIDKFQAEAPSPAPAPPAPAPAPLTATLKNKRSKKKKEKRTKRKKLRKDKKTESKDKKTGHKDTKRKDKKPERKDKKRKDKKTKGKHKRKA